MDGRRGIVFSKTGGADAVAVPCGKCVGCKKLHAQAWAVRCVHEAQFHALNCFITLTYEDKKVPEGGSLRKAHFQLFMKRLREFVSPVKISFFACGEYGSINRRPHYHALIFGMDFLDRTHWKGEGQGELFVSPTLERLWGNGFTSVGPLTPATAAYTAGYVTKKAGSIYEEVDKHGEIHALEKEFLLMSRRPAIGRRWIEQFAKDVYPDDFVVREGAKLGVPRYYDKILEVSNAELFAVIKAERAVAMRSDESWRLSNPRKLTVREEVATAKLGLRRKVL